MARVARLLACIALLTACGGSGEPPLRLAAQHVSRGSCPVSDGKKGAFGEGPLRVLLATWTPNAVRVDDAFEVKLGWYLDGPGDLEVIGTRIDGPGTLSYSTGYRPPGNGPRMEASTLTISAPGCYAVKARHAGAVITWVFRAVA